MDFKTLENHDLHGGIRYKFKAANGYGASIVRHIYSYGGSQGLYEVAVLNPEGNITYDTSITDDVLGYLSEEEVNQVLLQIEAL